MDSKQIKQKILITFFIIVALLFCPSIEWTGPQGQALDVGRCCSGAGQSFTPGRTIPVDEPIWAIKLTKSTHMPLT